MTREEAKRSSFKGKSNIRYLLGNRYHLQLPIPVLPGLRAGGEVVVDIVVDRSGEVLSATPRSTGNFSDPTILAYAQDRPPKKQSSMLTILHPKRSAGTITYLFVAQ